MDIRKGDSLDLHYAVLVLDEPASPQEIEALYREFAK